MPEVPRLRTGRPGRQPESQRGCHVVPGARGDEGAGAQGQVRQGRAELTGGLARRQNLGEQVPVEADEPEDLLVVGTGRGRPPTGAGDVATGEGETASSLLTDRSAFEDFDPDAAAARGMAFEQLDQLATDHLLGVRG